MFIMSNAVDNVYSHTIPKSILVQWDMGLSHAFMVIKDIKPIFSLKLSACWVLFMFFFIFCRLLTFFKMIFS